MLINKQTREVIVGEIPTNLETIEIPLNKNLDINSDEMNVFFQNKSQYTIDEAGNPIRIRMEEDLGSKQRFLNRIRKYRSLAMKLYDVYEVKILRGKQVEDPEVESWYQWALDFPSTYDNNLPYHKQVRPMPAELLKYK